MPLGPVNRGRLSSTLDLLRPTGFSPIAYSLERVTGDLPSDPGNTLVVVTGSVESCGGDPCAEATRLLESARDRFLSLGAAAAAREVSSDLDSLQN